MGRYDRGGRIIIKLMVRLMVMEMFSELSREAYEIARAKFKAELGEELFSDVLQSCHDYDEYQCRDDFWSPYSKRSEGGLGW